MNTKLMELDSYAFSKDLLSEAAELIKKGALVVFPTETVYGLGANALSAEAAAKIFNAKGRPADNPLIVHISNLNMLQEIAFYEESEISAVINAFWPGPLTLVLKKKTLIPGIVTGGLDTVAVRMPSHPIALALIDAAGVPVAAPSANLSGRPSPTDGNTAFKEMAGRVELVIDGGPSEIGIESTVVNFSSYDRRILRPGLLGFEELSPYIQGLKDFAGLCDDAARCSPGTRYTHYKPDSRILLYQSPDSLKNYLHGNPPVKTAVLAFEKLYLPGTDTILLKDLKELSYSLFRLFHHLEKENYRLIAVPEVKGGSLAKALMNRISRAADIIL